MPGSFLFDPNRCTGCAACRLACTIENGLPFGTGWRRIETRNAPRMPGMPSYHLSLACNHCDVPACMHACPALAYSRDRATGAVIVDPEKCIGCRYCAWACPYDAPVFDDDRGVMTKCTFCNHRLTEGLRPACVTLCPTEALGYAAELPAAERTQAVPGFPQAGLAPRLRIEPLREGRELPLMSAPVEPAATPAPAAVRPADVTWRSEWSLMAFTSMAAVLVAWIAARALGAGPGSSRPEASDPAGWIFVPAAAATLALATAHLGRKTRAWRALLNLRRSWLSREVAAVSAFIGLGAGHLLLAPQSAATATVAAATGFVALFCVDRVYGVLRRPEFDLRHSASALWTGLFLTGIFSGTAWLAGAFGGLKLVLYLDRRSRTGAGGTSWSVAAATVRLGCGFLLPLVLWSVDGELGRIAVVASAIVGEWTDRAEFYAALGTSAAPAPAHRPTERLAHRP